MRVGRHQRWEEWWSPLRAVTRHSPPGSPMRRERASRSCIWGPAGARHMCSACPAAGTTRSSGPVPPCWGSGALSEPSTGLGVELFPEAAVGRFPDPCVGGRSVTRVNCSGNYPRHSLPHPFSAFMGSRVLYPTESSYKCHTGFISCYKHIFPRGESSATYDAHNSGLWSYHELRECGAHVFSFSSLPLKAIVQ